MDRKRNTWAYRKKAEPVRQSGVPCLCGRYIDPALPREQAASASADHVLAVGRGGPLLGDLIPMHRVCNMRKGQHPDTPELRARLAAQPLEWDAKRIGKAQPRHSQEW